MSQLCETFRTLVTFVRSAATVQPLVDPEVRRICEMPRTFLTFVWLLAGVSSHVRDAAGLTKSVAAYFALVRFLAGMKSLMDV